MFIVIPEDSEEEKALGDYPMCHDQNVHRTVNSKGHSAMMLVEIRNKPVTRKNHLCHKVTKNLAELCSRSSKHVQPLAV